MDLLIYPTMRSNNEVYHKYYAKQSIESLPKCNDSGIIKIHAIEEHFILIQKLGGGYTATVYEGRCRVTGKIYAIKHIDKNRLSLIASQSYYKKVYAALSAIPANRHLLPSLKLLENETHFYIVMERCYGSDMVAYALSHRPGDISACHCRQLVYQILLAVHCLHSHHILHRDIKLDNIIFRQQPYAARGNQMNNSTLSDIALIDFDMCLLMDCPEPPKPMANKNEVSVVGTREYMPPESFKGIYKPASDLWSVGVVLFVLIDGHFPFDVNSCLVAPTKNEISKDKKNMGLNPSNATTAAGTTSTYPGVLTPEEGSVANAAINAVDASASQSRIIRRLLRQGVRFSKETYRQHPLAVDLIHSLLQYDYRARMQSAFDALHHPWLTPIPSHVPNYGDRSRYTINMPIQEVTNNSDYTRQYSQLKPNKHTSNTHNTVLKQVQRGNVCRLYYNQYEQPSNDIKKQYNPYPNTILDTLQSQNISMNNAYLKVPIVGQRLESTGSAYTTRLPSSPPVSSLPSTMVDTNSNVFNINHSGIPPESTMIHHNYDQNCYRNKCHTIRPQNHKDMPIDVNKNIYIPRVSMHRPEAVLKKYSSSRAEFESFLCDANTKKPDMRRIDHDWSKCNCHFVKNIAPVESPQDAQIFRTIHIRRSVRGPTLRPEKDGVESLQHRIISSGVAPILPLLNVATDDHRSVNLYV